ncbi:MAG: pilus assembly protein [Chloroflexota bacterium]|nr:pilus assembly protein [Chloroflexota bacterium]
MRALRRGQGRASARGQSLVEFAVSVPVFVMLLFGMLEFGFAFNHNLTLEYATREGARTGAALAKGTNTIPCANVDEEIIASVQRVLTSPGAPIDISRISEVRIYKADASGNQVGSSYNRWIPGAGPTVDSVPLVFRLITANWDACSRDNGSSPDSLGVSLIYSYRLISPLGVFLGMAGTPAFDMSDQTVMALNPS